MLSVTKLAALSYGACQCLLRSRIILLCHSTYGSPLLSTELQDSAHNMLAHMAVRKRINTKKNSHVLQLKWWHTRLVILGRLGPASIVVLVINDYPLA